MHGFEIKVGFRRKDNMPVAYSFYAPHHAEYIGSGDALTYTPIGYIVAYRRYIPRGGI